MQSRRFDWIVSNPPYLTENEWAIAAPEVRDYEPKGALVAADNGLADLFVILTSAQGYLNPGGCVALETGIAHHDALAIKAEKLGYESHRSFKDLNGYDRFFFCWS